MTRWKMVPLVQTNEMLDAMLDAGDSQTDAYEAGMVAVFREVRRVLRDDGTLWLNLGDSYARDPKKGGSGPGGKNGYGEGYTEATAVMAGRGAGGVLAPFGSGTKPKEKDLIGIPWRVAFALQDDGWVLRQEIVWAKPNPMPESVRDRCTKSHEQIFLFAKAEWSGPPPTAAEAVESAIAQGALK